MTILSDRQIRALCVCPETYFDNIEYQNFVFNNPNPRPLGESMQDRLKWFESEKAKFNKPMTQEMKDNWQSMITPFEPESVRSVEYEFPFPNVPGNENSPVRRGGTRKILSYGSSSFGYDVRLQEKFQIFTNVNGGEIDPKAISNHCMVEGVMRTDSDGSRYVVLPPNSYLLGVTVEHFVMPRDVLILAVGKSTMARAGAIINVTPVEPGFVGEIVIEIANSTSLPMRIYANEGISQFLFFQGSESCEVSYADRGGKYQFQQGIQLGKV